MLHIRTNYSGTAATMAKSFGAMKRTVQGWLEDAYVATLQHWHETIRPKHFQESATEEYGYRARQADYEATKQRALGHTRPLVYSGESERATERMQVRVAARSATLAMSPGNLAFNPKKGRVNMRKELTETTQAETDELAVVFQNAMDQSMRSRHDAYTETVFG